MTTKNAERVLEVFAAAVECRADGRHALLDELCGSDAELRAEVESLLAHDDADAPDDFMQSHQPALASPEQPPAAQQDPRVGGRLGRYLIKSVIATGGMGTVYLAEQEQPHRDVALKVIRPELASKSGLRRFEFESEFLAKLDHPNIAHVHEAGVHEEQGPAGPVRVPYFAMQHVEGARPITDFAKENGLGMTDRLRLFLQACDAVQHGHQKAIIHRDLKPANILVDGAGQVKVIDFGVARATDGDGTLSTVGTGLNSMIGTPQYMSPEQCEGDPQDVDVRSDVYSLGMVLYELLCDRRPYDVQGASIYHAARTVCESEPASPSRIDHRLRGDLEAIVLTALAKERSRRYQSVPDLAADICHYLKREPISVRPPSTWTRAMRWAGRHPVLVTGALASFVGLSIIIGTSLAVWSASKRPSRPDVNWVRGPLRGAAWDVSLVSYAGNSMRRYVGTHSIPFTHARLVDRPDELGGGRLMLLGFHQDNDPTFSRALVAIDVDQDLDTPTWARRIESGESIPHPRTPEINRQNQPGAFGVSFGYVADIFPESPGEEIVAVYQHSTFSQCILRIYDLQGDIVYEVWHDGNISSAYWMKNAGRLVLAGQSGLWTSRELHLCESGDDDSWCNEHPAVIMAIRPEFQRLLRDSYMSASPGPDKWAPEWYLTFLPANVGVNVTALTAGDADRSVGVGVVVLPAGQGGFILNLDTTGREIEGSRQRDNAYLSNQDRLPDVNEFKLVPFAEVVAEKLGQESATVDGP